VSKGKAYLIGNGYSLTPERLDALEDDITFAMNNIAGMFDKTIWRPTYYVMVSTRYTSDPEFRDRVERAVDAAQLSFIDAAYRDKSFFQHRNDIVFVGTHEQMIWGNTLTSMSKYATSMLTAMQIAAWYRYDPLYLLGVDGYRAEGANHFIGGEYSTTEIDVNEENENMRKAYQFARQKCPFQIYDLTESEGYGVFERL
jgi:hypothetical protein